MHPCCGGSLQTGTKIIAILNLVLSIFIIVFGIFIMTAGGVLASQSIDEKGNAPEDDKDAGATTGFVVMAVSIVLIFMGVLGLLMAILLLVGAIKRNRTMCMVWFVLTIIGLVMYLIETIGKAASGTEAGENVGGKFLGILLQSYFLWVVWGFMEELKVDTIGSPQANIKSRV